MKFPEISIGMLAKKIDDFKKTGTEVNHHPRSLLAISRKSKSTSEIPSLGL